jgi:hypothetical protein
MSDLLRTQLLTLVFGVMASVAIAFASTGCRKGERAEKADKPDHVYTIRGQVVELPDPKRPTTEFVIKHEAIDDFADSNGMIVGMGTMEMPFPPAKGVSLDGIAVGDIVQLQFGVWYKPSRWHALSVKKLPPDTRLDFRPARPQPPQ